MAAYFNYEAILVVLSSQDWTTGVSQLYIQFINAFEALKKTTHQQFNIKVKDITC